MRMAIDATVLDGGLTELLPEPEGEKTKPTGYLSGMGLREYRCAVCGKVFEAYPEYRYKLQYKHKVSWYCCHKHMRLHEAPMNERKKQETLGRWTDRASGRTERERAEAEVDFCRKKLEEWEARALAPEFAELNRKKRSAINQGVVKWRTKLLLAEERLEGMEDGKQ